MSSASLPLTQVRAIVPVRGLPAGKTRLAALLTIDQRNRLVRAMLEDVITALVRSERVSEVVLLSRDAAAAREAERLGVAFMPQPPEADGLNSGLAAAQRVFPGEPLLIVPADVPLIDAAAIAVLLDAVSNADAAVGIAPARDGGTNGLLLRPAAVIAPAFGQGSAAAHATAARAVGASVAEVHDPRWALDLDTPTDLARLLAWAAEWPDAAHRRTVQCLRAPDFPVITAAGE